MCVHPRASNDFLSFSVMQTCTIHAYVYCLHIFARNHKTKWVMIINGTKYDDDKQKAKA